MLLSLLTLPIISEHLVPGAESSVNFKIYTEFRMLQLVREKELPK